MKKIKLISSFLRVVQVLIILGGTFVCIFIFSMDNGVFVDVAEPYFKVKSGNLNLSENLATKLSDLLREAPQKSDNDPVIFHVNRIDMSVEVDLPFKILVTLLILVTVLYSFLVVWYMQKIILDIRNSDAFNDRNIKRIRSIGVLIMFAPVTEWIMQIGFNYWFAMKYSFPDMAIESTKELGWSVFIIGLLIYTLGYAFTEGKKLKEEQELTI